MTEPTKPKPKPKPASADERETWSAAALAELEAEADLSHIARWLVDVSRDIPEPTITYRVSACAYCGMTTIDEETDDEAEARAMVARILRNRRRLGHPIVRVDHETDDDGALVSATWECLEPADCAMVPDSAGFVSIDRQTDDDEARGEYSWGDDDEPSIDVRLQYIHETDRSRWSASAGLYCRSGLSDYDSDHTGSWGASSVCRGLDLDSARDIAEDMVGQCAEELAQTIDIRADDEPEAMRAWFRAEHETDDEADED